MSVSAKIKLYKQKRLSDGKHPILLEVIFQRKIKRISVGSTYKCLPDEWDDKSREFTRKFEGYKEKNRIIKGLEVKANQIIDDFLKTGKPFSFLIFEEQFRGGKKNMPTLFAFFEERINEMKAKNELSNASVYDSTKRVLKHFEPKNLVLTDIDYKFLNRFEVFLKERGNNGGGVINYMKTLRALLNEAMKRGYLPKDSYPFKNPYNQDGYSFAHIKSNAQPRALSPTDIEKVKNFPIKDYPNLNLGYKIFMFSYYGRGINFNDIAKLKQSNIYNGRIEYVRTKTSKPLSLPLSESLKAILNEFENTENAYLFPILTDFHKTPQQINDRIKKVNKQVNDQIKQLGDLLKIDVLSTTYVARHTFATTLKRKGGDIAKISEALGHADIGTTKAYLKAFEDDEIDALDQLL